MQFLGDRLQEAPAQCSGPPCGCCHGQDGGTHPCIRALPRLLSRSAPADILLPSPAAATSSSWDGSSNGTIAPPDASARADSPRRIPPLPPTPSSALPPDFPVQVRCAPGLDSATTTPTQSRSTSPCPLGLSTYPCCQRQDFFWLQPGAPHHLQCATVRCPGPAVQPGKPQRSDGAGLHAYLASWIPPWLAQQACHVSIAQELQYGASGSLKAPTLRQQSAPPPLPGKAGMLGLPPAGHASATWHSNVPPPGTSPAAFLPARPSDPAASEPTGVPRAFLPTPVMNPKLVRSLKALICGEDGTCPITDRLGVPYRNLKGP